MIFTGDQRLTRYVIVTNQKINNSIDSWLHLNDEQLEKLISWSGDASEHGGRRAATSTTAQVDLQMIRW